MTMTSSQGHTQSFRTDRKTVARLARRSVRDVLQRFIQLLSDCANKHLDPVETIHQLRVTSRRSDVALRLFSSALARDQWKRMQKTLKRVRDVAGEVRDLDLLEMRWRPSSGTLAVQVSEEAATWMHSLVLQQRLIAQRRLTRWSCRSSRDRIRKRSRELLNDMDRTGRKRRKKVVSILFELIQQLREAMGSTAWHWKNAHRTRIGARRLRYALEMLRQILPGDTSTQITGLTQVQEQLGQMNDDATATRHLRTGIEVCPVPSIALEFQRLVELCEASAKERLASWHSDELAALLDDVVRSIDETGRP